MSAQCGESVARLKRKNETFSLAIDTIRFSLNIIRYVVYKSHLYFHVNGINFNEKMHSFVHINTY